MDLNSEAYEFIRDLANMWHNIRSRAISSFVIWKRAREPTDKIYVCLFHLFTLFVCSPGGAGSTQRGLKQKHNIAVTFRNDRIGEWECSQRVNCKQFQLRLITGLWKHLTHPHKEENKLTQQKSG